jgi:hypothetical protein
MASAAATTSLPDAMLRTLFNHLPDAASLRRSLGQFGWDLLRNIALPASAAPAAKAHPAAPAQLHAPFPARAPHAAEHGAADTRAKPERKISVLFDNTPSGTRISTRAEGSAFHIDAGRGVKTNGSFARSGTGLSGGDIKRQPPAAHEVDAAPSAPPAPLPSAQARLQADRQADANYEAHKAALVAAGKPVPPLPSLPDTAVKAALTHVTPVTYGALTVQPRDSSAPGDAVTLQIGQLNGGDPSQLIAQLSQLPKSVLKVIQQHGIKFVASQNSVTEYIPGLAGTIARGHEQYTLKSLWDRTGGTFDSETNTVVVATGGAYGEGSKDMALHELGHALDYNLRDSHGVYLSDQPAFKAAYDKANANQPFGTTPAPPIYPNHNTWEDYFDSAGNPGGYRSEAFAESFAEAYSSNNRSDGNKLDSNNDPYFIRPDPPVPLANPRSPLLYYWWQRYK